MSHEQSPTIPEAPGIFQFTSAENLTHVIGHNLNNMWPAITVYDTVAGVAVTPLSITPSNPNVLQVEFAAPTAIAGTVVG